MLSRWSNKRDIVDTSNQLIAGVTFVIDDCCYELPEGGDGSDVILKIMILLMEVCTDY